MRVGLGDGVGRDDEAAVGAAGAAVDLVARNWEGGKGVA